MTTTTLDNWSSDGHGTVAIVLEHSDDRAGSVTCDSDGTRTIKVGEVETVAESMTGSPANAMDSVDASNDDDVKDAEGVTESHDSSTLHNNGSGVGRLE